MTILTENRDILDKIAVSLVEREKITGVELVHIIQKFNPKLIPDSTAKKVLKMEENGLEEM